MSNLGDLGRPIGGGGGPAGLTHEGGATGLTGGAAGLTGTHGAESTEFRESGEHGQGLGASGGVSRTSLVNTLPSSIHFPRQYTSLVNTLPSSIHFPRQSCGRR